MSPTVRLGVLTPSSNTTLEPQAITTFCTNLHAAGLAEEIEAGLGIPLLDTVSTTVWGMLRTAGADPGAARGWGHLYVWR